RRLRRSCAGAGLMLALAMLPQGSHAASNVVGWGDNSYGESTVPAGLSNVVAISAGDFDSLALEANGTVMAWGDNTYGELDTPAGLTNVVAIAAADELGLALKADSTVVGWG